MKHGIEHSRSQGLIDFAFEYAKRAHGTQKRKYTNEPYINHPVAVAKIVAEITDDCDMICAALLHDVIEDTDRTADDLSQFGLRIIQFVVGLTEFSKKSDGSRATRKALDARFLSLQCAQVQTIKLADLIDNTSSILEHDEDFARIYMAEKRSLVNDYLTKGDWRLRERASVIVERYYRSL